MSTTRMATPLPNLNASDPAAQWQRFCDLLWHHEPLGLWLDVSRMAVSAEQLEAFEQPFAQAFAAMDALEKGAIANPDEGRQVGHYWLRNPDLAPDRSVGEHISAELRRLQSFGADVLNGRLKASNGEPFTEVLWVGIGGSGLGPLLMIRALQVNRQGLPFHFLDNVDPAGMSRLYDDLGERLKTTLVIVVSKSGGTPEPHLGMIQSRERLERLGCRWSQHAVAVTMKDSKLDQEAAAEGWLNRFDMFDWVGGRTSITSAVGLLPAVLAGIDSDAFLRGAAVMDAATRRPSLRDNPAALMAASWYVAGDGKGKRDMVVLPYRDRLEVFSRYLQRLVMVSLGKRLDRQGRVVHQGIAVYGNKGSCTHASKYNPALGPAVAHVALYTGAVFIAVPASLLYLLTAGGVNVKYYGIDILLLFVTMGIYIAGTAVYLVKRSKAITKATDNSSPWRLRCAGEVDKLINLNVLEKDGGADNVAQIILGFVGGTFGKEDSQKKVRVSSIQIDSGGSTVAFSELDAEEIQSAKMSRGWRSTRSLRSGCKLQRRLTPHWPLRR